MNIEAAMVFDKFPKVMPLYHMAEEKMLAAFPDARIKVSKTQISFYNKHLFAALWPPFRKIKGSPEIFLWLTFGLFYRLDDSRIAQAVEPYPNRWTHHVIITGDDDMDDKVMGWLREAYDFALVK